MSPHSPATPWGDFSIVVHPFNAGFVGANNQDFTQFARHQLGPGFDVQPADNESGNVVSEAYAREMHSTFLARVDFEKNKVSSRNLMFLSELIGSLGVFFAGALLFATSMRLLTRRVFNDSAIDGIVISTLCVGFGSSALAAFLSHVAITRAVTDLHLWSRGLGAVEVPEGISDQGLWLLFGLVAILAVRSTESTRRTTKSLDESASEPNSELN